MSEAKSNENEKINENNNEIQHEESNKEINNNSENNTNEPKTQDKNTENNGKRKKTTSSLDKFGSRILKDESKVFEYNAWDNAEWDEKQEEEAREIVKKQKLNPVNSEMKEKYDLNANEYWNEFYTKNTNKFFKDRHWLRTEFPELFEIKGNEPFKIFEIGCGAGNTVFPILEESENPNLFIYAADFSKVAVDIVKNNPNFNEKNCKAFVYDITENDIPEYIEPHSLDICICIFVLSALNPNKWENACNNLQKMLKPGGYVLFRDYGRYDLAQLRFKKDRYLDTNFYVRGDGTQVYFFTTDEIKNIFEKYFELEQNSVDRRLIINRSRKLKMYRVWIQGKFKRKPLENND